MNKIFNNIYFFLQGNLRYKLYYSKFAFLIPKYIREQIKYRVANMNPKCYEDGACVMCGCKTIALQMANKACPKPCYPEMMNKSTWRIFKSGQLTINKFNYELGK